MIFSFFRNGAYCAFIPGAARTGLPGLVIQPAQGRAGFRGCRALLWVPFSSTMISSAFRTALTRWAMISFVVPESPFSACWIAYSVSMSSALVESSRIRIGLCLAMALAMLMRCFCRRTGPRPVSDDGLILLGQPFDEFACLSAFRSGADVRVVYQLPFSQPDVFTDGIRKEEHILHHQGMLPRSCFRDRSRMLTPSSRMVPPVAS